MIYLQLDWCYHKMFENVTNKISHSMLHISNKTCSRLQTSDHRDKKSDVSFTWQLQFFLCHHDFFPSKSHFLILELWRTPDHIFISALCTVHSQNKNIVVFDGHWTTTLARQQNSMFLMFSHQTGHKPSQPSKEMWIYIWTSRMHIIIHWNIDY